MGKQTNGLCGFCPHLRRKRHLAGEGGIGDGRHVIGVAADGQAADNQGAGPGQGPPR